MIPCDVIPVIQLSNEKCCGGLFGPHLTRPNWHGPIRLAEEQHDTLHGTLKLSVSQRHM